jgi:hypothetical protein
VGCKNKSDTSNNKGDWIYFKIVQKMPEQCKGKHEIKKITKERKPYWAPRTYLGKHIKAQNIQHWNGYYM